jgi:glycosyltransferase involved in cell wall biosynthesis
MVKISVAVPVRDGALFLKDALRSLAKQTFKDWECIVWDDGSTDSSRAIALSFMENDSRFRVGWSEQPEGLPQALNNAYSFAKGEYLGQLDSDDCLIPSCLEECLNVFNQEPDIDLVYTDSLVMNERRQLLGWGHSKNRIFDRLTLLEFSPVLHFRLIKSELLQRLGGYDERIKFGEDCDFTLRAAWGVNLKGKKIKSANFYHLQIPLYLRRIHPKQMTQVNKEGERFVEEIRKNIASQVLWSPTKFWRIKTGLLQILDFIKRKESGSDKRG